MATVLVAKRVSLRCYVNTLICLKYQLHKYNKHLFSQNLTSQLYDVVNKHVQTRKILRKLLRTFMCIVIRN
jgi:hypothetical protein